MIHLHSRFHIPDSNDTLDIAIKTTGKYLFHVSTTLSYIAQNLKYLTAVA
jgi:hypothetical protein